MRIFANLLPNLSKSICGSETCLNCPPFAGDSSRPRTLTDYTDPGGLTEVPNCYRSSCRFSHNVVKLVPLLNLLRDVSVRAKCRRTLCERLAGFLTELDPFSLHQDRDGRRRWAQFFLVPNLGQLDKQKAKSDQNTFKQTEWVLGSAFSKIPYR